MTFSREGAQIGFKAGIILDYSGEGKGFGGNATYDNGKLNIESYMSAFPGHPQRGIRIVYDSRLVYDVIDGSVRASVMEGKWGDMIDQLFDEAYEIKKKRDESMPWINPYATKRILNEPEKKPVEV